MFQTALKRVLIPVLLDVFLWAGVPAANAATPPPGTIEKATAWMEWLLDVPFTAEQKQHYQQDLAATFRSENKKGMDGILKSAAMQDQLAAMTEKERETIQLRTQGPLLQSLRANSNDAGAKWLLEIYSAGHPSSEDQPRPAALPQTPIAPPRLPPAVTQVTPELIGGWSSARMSSPEHQERITHRTIPASGTTAIVEFAPNGAYTYSTLTRNTILGCTITIVSKETGSYSLQGEILAARATTNLIQTTNSCRPANRDVAGQLLNRSYRVRISREGGKQRLDLISTQDGVTSTLYR